MYTGDDALIADNAFRNELFGGITVMTRPSGNAIVGNDVRNSSAGVQASGTRTYVGTTRSSATNSLLDQLARVAVRAQRGREQRAGRTSDHGRPVEPDRRERLRRQRGPRDRRGGRAPVWADGDRRELLGGATSGSTSPASERTARPPGRRCPLHREVAAVAVRESPAVAPSTDSGTVPGRALGGSSIRRRRRSRTRRTGSTPRSTRTRDRSVPTGAPNWATVAERATRTQQ